jgi:hypothetical protein
MVHRLHQCRDVDDGWFGTNARSSSNGLPSKSISASRSARSQHLPDMQVSVDPQRWRRPVRDRSDQLGDRPPARVQHGVGLGLVAELDVGERFGEQGLPAEAFAAAVDRADRPWEDGRWRRQRGVQLGRQRTEPAASLISSARGNVPSVDGIDAFEQPRPTILRTGEVFENDRLQLLVRDVASEQRRHRVESHCGEMAHDVETRCGRRTGRRVSHFTNTASSTTTQSLERSTRDLALSTGGHPIGREPFCASAALRPGVMRPEARASHGLGVLGPSRGDRR